MFPLLCLFKVAVWVLTRNTFSTDTVDVDALLLKLTKEKFSCPNAMSKSVLQ